MNNPFSGLIGFPLTPMHQQKVDFTAFEKLLDRQLKSELNAVCVLGSTGCYPYLSLKTRKDVLSFSRNLISDRPLMCAIGGISQDTVMRSLDDAQSSGVDGVFLSPVSYQPLTPDEVFSLYEAVSKELSVPLCVYFNAATTKFEFSDDLLSEISYLPHVSSIKMLGIKDGKLLTEYAINSLKDSLKKGTTVGVSGDHVAINGLKAGCDAWYSVLAGLHPNLALRLYQSLHSDDEQNVAIEPLWELFKQYGSLRVIATMAELEKVVSEDCLPLPLKTLGGEVRQKTLNVISQIIF